MKVGFVHIPKTGGTSIVSVLTTCVFLQGRVLPSQHSNFHESALQQRTLRDHDWDHAYTFAVVRNPYDWAVSQFFWRFALESCANKTSSPTCRVKDSFFRKNGSRVSYSVDHKQHFLQWLLHHEELARTRGKFMADYVISGPAIDNKTSQFWWTVGVGNKLLVDHVVKYENKTDFDLHASCNGWRPSSPKRFAGPGSPHKFKTNHKHYVNYYNEQSREIVKRRFLVDFQYFNYSSYLPLVA